MVYKTVVFLFLINDITKNNMDVLTTADWMTLRYGILYEGLVIKGNI